MTAKAASSDRSRARARDKGRNIVVEQAKRLERLNIAYVDRRLIRPNPFNPNRLTPQQWDWLLRSMTLNGFTQPILVRHIPPEPIGATLIDGETGEPIEQPAVIGEIIDGEHRWQAASQVLGEDAPIPLVWFDVDLPQMQATTLLQNWGRGQDDGSELAALLRDARTLGHLDYLMEQLHVTEDTIDALLSDLPIAPELAAPAYSAAWEPALTSATPPPDGPPQVVTPAATAILDAAELAQAEAVIAKERRKGARETGDVYRLVLTFSPDEGAIVKRVLGDHPADRVLELCMAADGLLEGQTHDDDSE